MSTHGSAHGRTYDIIIFGATSFVGRLIAEYMVANHGDMAIALAARNKEKLAQLNNSLAKPLPTIVADVDQPDSIARMVQQASTVISTVGPYSRWGEVAIAACVEHETHYVDLCGEAPFIRRMIDTYHEDAKDRGVAIVPACGFDSVPSDMGMLRLHQKAGEPLREVTMIVDAMKGGLSGGTVDSMREVVTQSRKSDDSREASSFALSPDPLSEERARGKQNDLVIEKFTRGGFNTWLAPFFMAFFNTRVVRRSHSLLGHQWGSQLRYREAMKTRPGIKGRLAAYGITASTGAGLAVLSSEKLSKLLANKIPQPGEGPTERSRNSGFFRIAHVGITESGREVTSWISCSGDPGYKATAMMISEAAVTLTLDGSACGGGVLTPATALSYPYLDRLRHAGMEFS